ncbi:hypothetical protein B0O99DRAFT_670424 [Bisporella sp. PMI_857]|nr:hypothetical protein B0O99DRAFT_670424 [Bisporella sp. PMI_857]
MDEIVLLLYVCRSDRDLISISATLILSGQDTIREVDNPTPCTGRGPRYPFCKNVPALPEQNCAFCDGLFVRHMFCIPSLVPTVKLVGWGGWLMVTRLPLGSLSFATQNREANYITVIMSLQHSSSHYFHVLLLFQIPMPGDCDLLLAEVRPLFQTAIDNHPAYRSHSSHYGRTQIQ